MGAAYLMEIIAGLLSRAVLEGDWTRRTVWTLTILTVRRWKGYGTETWRIVWIGPNCNLDVVQIPTKLIAGFSVFSFSHPENMKSKGKKRVLIQSPHQECALLHIFYWKILVIAVLSKTK